MVPAKWVQVGVGVGGDVRARPIPALTHDATAPPVAVLSQARTSSSITLGR